MPAIKSISVENNKLTVYDSFDSYVFTVNDVPVGIFTSGNPTQELEDYLNETWLPSVANGNYQIKVHVFSVSPLALTVWTGDPEVVCPDNWWAE